MKKINLKPLRVLRGGGWFFYASNLRAAFRLIRSPSAQNRGIGTRLVRGKR
jgi:formylglycine-generating enzyme required for sulfatase activity